MRHFALGATGPLPLELEGRGAGRLCSPEMDAKELGAGGNVLRRLKSAKRLREGRRRWKREGRGEKQKTAEHQGKEGKEFGALESWLFW